MLSCCSKFRPVFSAIACWASCNFGSNLLFISGQRSDIFDTCAEIITKNEMNIVRLNSTLIKAEKLRGNFQLSSFLQSGIQIKVNSTAIAKGLRKPAASITPKIEKYVPNTIKVMITSTSFDFIVFYRILKHQ